jgi:DNA repair protein RAD7
VENYDVPRKDIVFEQRKEIALSSVRKRQSRRKEQKLMQREIARNVAPRFAHLGPQEQQMKQHKEKKVKLREVDLEMELDLDDSQSPFSLALEAIKMRQTVRKGSLTGFSESLFKWVPAKAKDCDALKRDVPTLLDLSLNALAKNADAIVSLEHVPDKLRHRLSQLVSDCGVVDAHFVELLARGSPTEIRLRNISRLTEEEFSKIFSVCDTKDLTVSNFTGSISFMHVWYCRIT